MINNLTVWQFGNSYFELGIDLSLFFTTMSVFTGTSWKE